MTVLTEGIFRNRIQADPELAGVSAVLFDEVHERSLDSDFGLALALDAQGALRPDLRLVAMSATLDGARFAALFLAVVVLYYCTTLVPLIHGIRQTIDTEPQEPEHTLDRSRTSRGGGKSRQRQSVGGGIDVVLEK